MNLRTTWALASAEMRSCRRLARTWVFIVVALLLSALVYFFDVGGAVQGYWPESPSGWSHMTLAPQYTVSNLVLFFGSIFVIGITFLSFDIRARDVQTKIHEVIDSTPANNLEIIVGRQAGILLLLLVPILFFLVAFTCYEVLAHYLELSLRYGLLTVASAWGEIFSAMIFLLLFGSVVACLAVLLRNRLLVALISLGLLCGLVTLSEQPFFQLQEVLIHSDIVSAPFNTTGLVIQLALLLLSVAFITFASSLLPRTQPNRQLLNVAGGICFVAAILSITGVKLSSDQPNSLRNEWIAAHNSQTIEAFPDIQHLQGVIDLWPNDTVKFDLTLTVRPPASNPTDSVVFSLNPDYQIQSVYIDDHEVEEEDYTFELGLLKISASKWTADLHQLRITAHGKPNEHFAFLDQARNLSETPSVWLARFGTKNYIFHSNFVALMPSVKWYPTSGTAMHEDLLDSRPRDVFTTDLTVSVPKDWTVAMVGSRELINNGERYVYRFQSHAPVPELALIGSMFDQRGKTIEGIGFELLFSKKHTKNLDVLAPHVSEFEEWVADHVRSARDLSLAYPYESFYVVEVPSTLRIYGGGWRMDTVLHPPGMMLVRETTFPTERFELVVDEQDSYANISDNIVRTWVLAYFRDDLQGGSPNAGISRNFVNHQSSPSGRGSTAINYLLEQLSTQLIMNEESIFVPSLWEYRVQPPQADRSDFLYSTGRVSTRKRLILLRTPSTWEYIESTPLFELDFQSRPIPAFRALLTKSYALAEHMIEYYGTEKVAFFLQQLISTYKGRNYTLEDFVRVAADSEIDLNDWVLDWLERTALPGFIVADIKVAKLKSNEDSPYQTTFVVHNAEPVGGFVQVRWNRIRGGNSSDPIFLHGHESVEIAIQTHEPLREIWIQPNFSRNRDIFPVVLPIYDGETISDDPAKPLVSKVEWLPPDSEPIVVDDLDPGFTIVGHTQKKRDNFKIPGFEFGMAVEESVDQGLPVRGISIIGEWERKIDPYTFSFGRYRHTLALIAKGTKKSYAKFAAELPHSGSWQLEYFVPGRVNQGPTYDFLRGSGSILQSSVLNQPRANPDNPDEQYSMQVTDGQSTWNEKFDIANASFGWNKVNVFELSSDKVDVLVSDFAGRADVIVYADAIRWTPIEQQ
ncbi:MAG: hypothetical protein F4219_08325 [Gammaproteobacteria bacterium]|nr:hypothetical protein [Gammaproteobacteria bacterium]